MSLRAVIAAVTLLLAGGGAVLLWQTGHDGGPAPALAGAAPDGCSSCDAHHRDHLRMRELLSGPTSPVARASLPSR